MGERYVPIRIGEMHKVLGERCGFTQLEPGSVKFGNRTCKEHIYERQVVSKSGIDYHCKIRVYTSVDIRTSVTRDCASDAIRVVVINDAGYPIKRDGKGREARIYRTKNAKTNLYERCREIFKWAMENACQTCYHPLVERTVKKEGPNQGRKFLTCITDDCNHFEWVD